MMHPMSVLLLETFVLSKPYFDRLGLIMALEDGKPIGFVHAGFGPNTLRTEISNDIGVICMLIVADHPQREQIQSELIQHSESYLRGKGAIEIHAFGAYPNSPFYLGLYGGSASPGILSFDQIGEKSFRQAGYEEIERYGMFERSLVRYRFPIDRSLVQLKRQFRVRLITESRQLSWWDACAFGPTDRMRFVMEPKRGGDPVGEVSFWDMGPLAYRSGGTTMGMIDLMVEDEHQQRGCGTYLVAESLQQLAKSGISMIQTQAAQNSTAACKILSKLGFEQRDYGTLLGK